MKKLQKLILTTGIFSSSLSFNSAYSQKTGEYYIGNPNDPKSEIKKIDGKTWTELNNQNNYSYWMKDAVDRNGITKWYIVPKAKPQATPSQNKTENSNTNASNKTQFTNTNKTYAPNKNEINWDKTISDAILIGGGILLLNELLKPRNKVPIANNATPVNNPPTNYNSEENKKTFDEWINGKEETENKKTFDEWINGKELEGVLKEQGQKKAEAKLRSEKSSRELSDFVEKQAKYSPETKIWFDKEYKEAEEFYKEFYKNDPKAYAETQKYDKLHKVIGYNAYKMGKKSPQVGKFLERMEIYEDIKGKGMENYWKEEVKEADEFLKQYESNPKLKVIYDEKKLEEKFGAEIYVPKIEKDKYGKQINKIAYESDVAKVIRYRAYLYIKNNTEAGKVIEGIEKVDEMKKDNSKNFWDE